MRYCILNQHNYFMLTFDEKRNCNCSVQAESIADEGRKNMIQKRSKVKLWSAFCYTIIMFSCFC